MELVLFTKKRGIEMSLGFDLMLATSYHAPLILVSFATRINYVTVLKCIATNRTIPKSLLSRT